jgi:hypothetical protein
MMNEMQTMATRFDRTEEDVGNIVELGHVNLRVPDQRLATLFYISGLGLTRDPYLVTGIENMWINVGRSQFHLPTGQPQTLNGVTGIVVPEREALLRRLAAVRPLLEGTRFAFREHADYVETVCPWGNRIRVHQPDVALGHITLGMPYVELHAPSGTLDGIAQFYREVLHAPAQQAEDRTGRALRVPVSIDQVLIYRETDEPVPAYDGHHIQITLADFSGPHRWLNARGLITQESDQHQYRFTDIVDVGTGKVLHMIEHETRSMRHPLFNRVLVNRNPRQTNAHYAPGHDALAWAMPN